MDSVRFWVWICKRKPDKYSGLCVGGSNTLMTDISARDRFSMSLIISTDFRFHSHNISDKVLHWWTTKLNKLEVYFWCSEANTSYDSEVVTPRLWQPPPSLVNMSSHPGRPRAVACKGFPRLGRRDCTHQVCRRLGAVRPSQPLKRPFSRGEIKADWFSLS